jgi:hypothetical protein
MRISLDTSIGLTNVFTEISSLTDRAIIALGDIRHDALSACVEIPLQRRELLGYKKTWLGQNNPIYGRNSINSVLKIRNVTKMIVEVDKEIAAECNGRFTLLMGIKITDGEVHLSSVEESRGKQLCQVTIEISEVDIEIYDI